MKNLQVIIVAMPGTWQKVLQKNLEAHPSVDRVDVAHGSLSAMQMAEEHKPDLLLIDSGIPTDETIALLDNIKLTSSDTRSVVLTDTSRQGRRITLAGADFTLPTDRQCTLAFSRLMDETEILIALNIDFSERNDLVVVDFDLHRDGERMVDLLRPGTEVPIVERNGRKTVRVNLGGLQMAILKKAPTPVRRQHERDTVETLQPAQRSFARVGAWSDEGATARRASKPQARDRISDRS